MEERTGEAFELGEELTVVGSKIGRDDRIAYAEYAPDQMREPDYAAMEAARRAAS